MESLGNFLKNRRKEKGYSLEDAQEETKIQIKYLQALEEEKFEVLPGEVFTRGFIRSYADFLGLSAEEAIKRYQGFKDEKVEAENKKEIEVKKTEEPEIKPVPPEQKKKERLEKVNRETKALPLIVAAVIIIALGAWIYNKFVTPPTPMPKENLSQQEQPKENLSNNQNKQISPLPAPVYVKTIIHQDCWMQVTVDGKIVFAGQLVPETIREWKGQKEITLRLGNAGGVQVKYNGQDLGTLGGKGEVINKTFTPNQTTP